MQWIDSHLFKLDVPVENERYNFVPFKRDVGEIAPTDYIELERVKRSFIMHHKSSITKSTARESKIFPPLSLYLFFICNDNSFHDVGFNDYEIQLHQACYFRSTPIMKLKKQNNQWQLINPIYAKLINKNEAFSVTHRLGDNNKVYIVNIDYQVKNTTLWHYSFTDKEAKEDNFIPKTFEKKIEHLPSSPFNFKDRNKLVKKFDNWILVS